MWREKYRYKMVDNWEDELLIEYLQVDAFLRC